MEISIMYMFRPIFFDFFANRTLLSGSLLSNGFSYLDFSYNIYKLKVLTLLNLNKEDI
jgi:hypothetical protein